MPGKAKLMVAAVLMTSFLVPPMHALFQQQQKELVESMPEGKGKELVRTLCTAGCHSLETTVMQRKSKEGWEMTVTDMMSKGAQLFTDEAEAIISYLGEHYRTAAALASKSSDSAGKELLMNKCFQCHGDGMWKDLRSERRGWEGVLYRMVGRGALWTEEEISQMAEYLTLTYPAERAEQP